MKAFGFSVDLDSKDIKILRDKPGLSASCLVQKTKTLVKLRRNFTDRCYEL